MSITRIRKTRKLSNKARALALIFVFGGLGFMMVGKVDAASVWVMHGHGHVHPHAGVHVVRARHWHGPVRRPHRGRTVIVAAPPRPAPLWRLTHAAVDAAFLLD